MLTARRNIFNGFSGSDKCFTLKAPSLFVNFCFELSNNRFIILQQNEKNS